MFWWEDERNFYGKDAVKFKGDLNLGPLVLFRDYYNYTMSLANL